MMLYHEHDKMFIRNSEGPPGKAYVIVCLQTFIGGSIELILNAILPNLTLGME